MIVATAGHVDHGKTSLVKALTGVDADRLPEEKKRGMTIDLGFAYLPFTGGSIGFVDVPGHERFIHNMLCGVPGIDFALLVVAADDGAMPQTQEHLAILDLLGVSRGAVALTKIDRSSPARVDEVRAEIGALLEGTALAGAPVFPLSSATAAGVSALKAHLEDAARDTLRRDTRGHFRMSVDRCFTITGAGLVVTGTAISGEIAVGGEVRALLAGAGARVRSIHAHNAPADTGRAGQRLALNLAGVDGKKPISRGDWIVQGEVPQPVRRIDARLRVVGGDPLKHWTPVHVHLGAAHTLGRVAVLEADAIVPGASARVQLVLDNAVGALRGDGFVVRDQSSRRTLGGGTVTDVYPPARGRAKPERIAWLAAMEIDDDADAMRALLALAPAGVDLARFAANRNLRGDAEFGVPEMRSVAGTGFAPASWSALKAGALQALARWHAQSPDSAGLAEERLLATPRLPRAVLASLADELAADGAVVRDGAAIRLAGHRAKLNGADAALWDRLLPLLNKDAFRPPSLAELAVQLKMEPRKLEGALMNAVRQGFLVRVSKTRFFLPAALRAFEQFAREEAAATGAITAAAFRDRSGIGRNATIEVLEYFDRIKFTRRAGDRHVLLGKPIGRESHPGGAPGLQIR
ncbi:MAG: selenocysteine-specific translation elongation factor [Betaproteobacteria bacterium]